MTSNHAPFCTVHSPKCVVSGCNLPQCGPGHVVCKKHETAQLRAAAVPNAAAAEELERLVVRKAEEKRAQKAREQEELRRNPPYLPPCLIASSGQ